ncbi:MAG TPA: hypothetical protein HA252_02045 [Candidatus Diapherotrites archaeon]|uniref:PH domain-containing protein n=1 Tax=Candidatus Iainarchaeum sp. TaxID=3101447 RepID=A0A7J4JEG8_9ARCH|nr:hypothetical protein [Candidatus Diapherotrites archaeon]HIH16162.1 hypothetical protein [Candidatus Diapherotrites archaeon]
MAVERVLYEEQAPVGWAFKGFWLALVAALAALLYYLSQQAVGIESLAPGLAALGLVVLAFYWLYLMRFVATEQALEIRLPFYSYRVPVQDISSAELVDRVPFYIGWGVRMSLDTLYFVSQHKQSMLVHKKSGHFKKLVLTAREPVKLMAGIQAAQRLLQERQEQAAAEGKP